MTATVKINLGSPQAVSLVNYLETLPFAEVKRTGKVSKETFEPIPGFAYTHEERMASVEKGLADIEAGRTFTMEQVRAKFPRV